VDRLKEVRLAFQYLTVGLVAEAASRVEHPALYAAPRRSYPVRRCCSPSPPRYAPFASGAGRRPPRITFRRVRRTGASDMTPLRSSTLRRTVPDAASCPSAATRGPARDLCEDFDQKTLATGTFPSELAGSTYGRRPRTSSIQSVNRSPPLSLLVGDGRRGLASGAQRCFPVRNITKAAAQRRD
jgi:hypothetical protein